MSAQRADLLTIAAIACASIVLQVTAHEAIGHGLTALALGAHVFYVTNNRLYYDPRTVTLGGDRLIAAAGPMANIVLGLAALFAMRMARRASGASRYFLWLLGHTNLFAASAYMLALSFSSNGDIHAVVVGLPATRALQIGFTIVGALAYLLTLQSARRTLTPFLGEANHRVTTSALTLLPYLVIGLANTLAGAFNPQPMPIAMSAAAATFGANLGLVWLAVRTRRSGLLPSEPASIGRSYGWIAAGVVAACALVAGLGPGIPRP